jgi:hypothetical protein
MSLLDKQACSAFLFIVHRNKEEIMRCVICGEPRMADNLFVFSYRGFRQTMSVFNITPLEEKNIAEKLEHLPIHVCLEHLQRRYCAICGKPRMASDLIVFSYGGFRQTMSVFDITPLEEKNIAEKIKYLPIHVCPEHLQRHLRYA